MPAIIVGFFYENQQLSLTPKTLLQKKAVFPKSKKSAFFSQKESMISGRIIPPSGVLFKDYAWEWYNILKESKRVTDRTLLGYKSHITLYLIPFFGERSFENINAGVLDEFVSWARRQRFKNKTISNKTINKTNVWFL